MHPRPPESNSSEYWWKFAEDMLLPGVPKQLVHDKLTQSGPVATATLLNLGHAYGFELY